MINVKVLRWLDDDNKKAWTYNFAYVSKVSPITYTCKINAKETSNKNKYNQAFKPYLTC